MDNQQQQQLLQQQQHLLQQHQSQLSSQLQQQPQFLQVPPQQVAPQQVAPQQVAPQLTVGPQLTYLQQPFNNISLQQQAPQAPPPPYTPITQPTKKKASKKHAQRHRQMASPYGGFYSQAPPMQNKSVEFKNPDITKSMDKRKCFVSMLVDRSGSMSTMGGEVASSANKFIGDQRKGDKDLNTNTEVLFATFDNHYSIVHNCDIKKMPEITDSDVCPRGGTALNDAIGFVINDTIDAMNKMKERPGEVIVFILTDGQENSSGHFSSKAIKDKIKVLEEEPYEWEFIFAAANQDAFATGNSYGMAKGAKMNWAATPQGFSNVLKMSSAQCMHQRVAKQASYFG